MALNRKDRANLERALKEGKVTREMLDDIKGRQGRLSVRESLGLAPNRVKEPKRLPKTPEGRIRISDPQDPTGITSRTGAKVPLGVREAISKAQREAGVRQPIGREQERARKLEAEFREKESRRVFEQQVLERINQEGIAKAKQDKLEKRRLNPTLFDKLKENVAGFGQDISDFFDTPEEAPISGGNAILNELVEPTSTNNTFDTEEDARAAGFQNGDPVVINGQSGRLA